MFEREIARQKNTGDKELCIHDLLILARRVKKGMI
jgi:hypothetical protein